MPSKASALPSAPLTVDPYTIELNKAIQHIIKNDPKKGRDEYFYKKDLLLLIFNPHLVPGLRKNVAAKEAAHALYLTLQQEAMNKVATQFKKPPPSYEESMSSAESPVPMPNNSSVDAPPSYEDAYRAYHNNRRYCEGRRESWCGKDFDNRPYYSSEYIAQNRLLVNMVWTSLDLTLYGAMLVADLARFGAGVGAHAGSSDCSSCNCLSSCNGDCGKELAIVFVAVIIAAIALGLLAFATSELVKAYQEDKDSHSSTRKLTIIAPTLIASAAAGYCAAAYVAVLTGLTVSTGGIALAVAVAVSVTAVLSVLVFKMLTNIASTHRYKLNENEKERLEARGVDTKNIQEQINKKRDRIHALDSCFIFFSNNDAIRRCRQEIYNLRTNGCEAPLRTGLS